MRHYPAPPGVCAQYVGCGYVVDVTTRTDPQPRYRLTFPNKALRADVIAHYVRAAGYRGCVCFSCGNASAALREHGLYVVDVSPSGELVPTRWWQLEEIRKAWPDLFDATSGHLPAPLMVRVAARFRSALGPLFEACTYEVPTGSGETITCLRWAYPRCRFAPVSDGTPATARDERAPLRAVAEELPACR